MTWQVILVLMLLGHLVADYTLQGWLADGKHPARVKEIGNGQFPLTAAAAFHWGLCVLQLVNKGEK